MQIYPRQRAAGWWVAGVEQGFIRLQGPRAPTLDKERTETESSPPTPPQIPAFSSSWLTTALNPLHRRISWRALRTSKANTHPGQVNHNFPGILPPKQLPAAAKAEHLSFKPALLTL